jgi:hypothetical protein
LKLKRRRRRKKNKKKRAQIVRDKKVSYIYPWA